MTTIKMTGDSASQADDPNVDAQVTAAIAAADGIVPGHLQELQWTYQARSARLSRTAANLRAQYGANDSRVKSAEAALAASQKAAARVGIAKRQLATPAPAVAAAGWALHGRVYDDAGKPVPRLTVFLADASKNYLSAYGYAYTDDSGYFLLNYNGAAGAQGDVGAAAGASEPALFVQVSDLNERTMYSGPTAFAPATGGASYSNIMLSAGDAPIGEPPAGAAKGPPPKRKPKG
jgi:hypothetical protein